MNTIIEAASAMKLAILGMKMAIVGILSEKSISRSISQIIQGIVATFVRTRERELCL